METKGGSEWLKNAHTSGSAAKELGVTLQAVRDFIRAGRLYAIQTDLGFLIDREDVEKLAKARSQPKPVETRSADELAAEGEPVA